MTLSTLVWRRSVLVAVAALIVLVALMMAQHFAVGDIGVKLKPDEAEVVAQGQAIYVAHCAACHGLNLEGEPGWPDWRKRKSDGRMSAPPHDETGHTWHHDDATLFRVTKVGLARYLDDPSYASDMPAYEGVLGDDEIVAVLSFIKSTWTGDERAFNERVNDPSLKLQ